MLPKFVVAAVCGGLNEKAGDAGLPGFAESFGLAPGENLKGAAAPAVVAVEGGAEANLNAAFPSVGALADAPPPRITRNM